MTNLHRVLGIDYGSHRIGIALSDPLCILAQPLKVVMNSHDAIGSIVNIIRQNDVQSVVVGMPLNLKGETAAKAKEVEAFIRSLQEQSSVEIIPWDERFTTTIAHKSMRDLGVKKKDRRNAKGRIDMMAAALILQSYLDSTKHSRAC